VIHRLEELEKYQGPKVVLATNAAMESGFSRQLFLKWASDKKNTIILTERGTPGSIARMLRDSWFEHYAGASANVVHPAVELNRSIYLQVGKA
jgi:cleavage and polyadenylation specificity factor subunit 2